LQAALAANRSSFYRDLAAGPFYGYNRPGVKSSEAVTDDLKKITVPVLVMHSEDDQIVPYVASGPMSAKLLNNGTLKRVPRLSSTISSNA
jgi:non-heme chloroperoxidase